MFRSSSSPATFNPAESPEQSYQHACQQKALYEQHLENLIIIKNTSIDEAEIISCENEYRMTEAVLETLEKIIQQWKENNHLTMNLPMGAVTGDHVSSDPKLSFVPFQMPLGSNPYSFHPGVSKKKETDMRAEKRADRHKRFYKSLERHNHNKIR